MHLTHIEIGNLAVAAVNMRHGKKAPDISDILPSVRARGVLVPLLVRPNGQPDHFEIVAGRRRFFAMQAVAAEGGTVEPVPCAVMEPGDDAAALEASLIENIARLDPDEMNQYETFARLVKQGRTVAEIAATFGLTERRVNQRLALGNLLPKIRTAYRNQEIDIETVRYLTLATKSQQQDWLALFSDPDTRPPRGSQLKAWLFGGQSIPTKLALFDLADYPGEIVADLFGEDSYFADPNLFWQRQNEAIAAKRDALEEAGWREVIVMEPGEHFSSWEFEKTPMRKGGKVYISVSQRGEVEIHEGYLSRKEARQLAKAEQTPAVKSARPEVSKDLQSYIDLHRHAAVRVALLAEPGVALRLAVAHAVANSGHWRVTPEPQATRSEEVKASLKASASEAAFAEQRGEILALLGGNAEDETVLSGYSGDTDTVDLFARLLKLSDEEVLRVLALVMGESLEAGSAVVEALGVHLKLDMAQVWQADDAFFDLIRDRQVINALLADVAGQRIAGGNVTEKVAAQKRIVRDCLAGTNGRSKVENWLPGWIAFPPKPVTERGGVNAVDQWRRVSSLFAA
jgi:ParB family chromosome partitioning protein